MKNRSIIWAARLFSACFNPFYLPLMGLIALFVFSYLSLLPLGYKLFVLILVYLFTVLIPTLLIRIYHRYQGWSFFERMAKERRVIPYIISILSYFMCYYIMHLLHIPHFMACIVMVALIIQMACAFINMWWKISRHTAAIGGLAGGLLVFSFIFAYNPVWWFCIIMLVYGVVGTSLIIMRQHDFAQVAGGFLVGLVVSFLTISFM